MPVQIGANAHTFTNPTGLLSDCHRRVEMFLGILEEVAVRIDRPITKDTGRGLETALRYFERAAPKHTADEEESLFPRLRQIDNPEIQSALSRLEKLEEDHRWAAPLHSEVERLGTQYLSGAELSDTEIATFRDSVARLACMYKQHIGIEDELIFPLAARLLPWVEKRAIAQEMAARRKVPLVVDMAGVNP